MNSLQVRKDYFVLMYKKRAEEWASCEDDRKVFSNIYYLILNSLDELLASKITSVYTIAAFNRAMNKDSDRMDDILARFAEKEARDVLN